MPIIGKKVDMKKNACLIFIYSLTGFLLISCSHNSTPSEPELKSPDLDMVMNSVNSDTLIKFVNQLSGELPVIVDNQTVVISSRHKDYPGNNLAADFITKKLNDYGTKVFNQEFTVDTPTGRNVYGLQAGFEFPEQIYIICAHYDSMPDSSISPGADDNASGTAVVLEAARVLSAFRSKYSIIYALWDEEEQGLRGSFYYAGSAKTNELDIRGVINIDMIAWDSNDDGRFWINVRDTANSAEMADCMLIINDQGNLGLAPQVLNPGSGSDNIAFWYFGYSAIGIEEMYGEDWNDYYHTTEDRMDKFNLIYFYKCSQLIITTLASLTGIA